MSLIASGALVGTTLLFVGTFVILIPPIFGIWLGHRIGVRYSQLDQTTQKRKKRPIVPVVAMVFLILVIQISLVAFLFFGGEYLWGLSTHIQLTKLYAGLEINSRILRKFHTKFKFQIHLRTRR